jgi:hypothetical protein
MFGGLIKMVVTGAKTLIGNKTTRDILKYLATATLAHASNKFNINRYKYDSNDMKNMIYHHNLNSDNYIDKHSVDDMINIMSIKRFADELASKENISDDPMNMLVNNLTQVTNDDYISRVYSSILENNIIQQFDTDTLETSSIADNYELSSGGIYLPDNNIYTSTIEGCNLANAKNEYLETRLKLGENASKEEVQQALNNYYNKIDYDKVYEYFRC